MSTLRGTKTPTGMAPRMGPRFSKPSWSLCDRAECLDCKADLPKEEFRRSGLFGANGPRVCPNCGSTRLLPYHTEDARGE